LAEILEAEVWRTGLLDYALQQTEPNVIDALKDAPRSHAGGAAQVPRNMVETTADS
jgi:hypothetical protein